MNLKFFYCLVNALVWLLAIFLLNQSHTATGLRFNLLLITVFGCIALQIYCVYQFTVILLKEMKERKR